MTIDQFCDNARSKTSTQYFIAARGSHRR